MSRSFTDLDLSEVGDDGGNFETQTYHSNLYTGPICDPHIHFFDLERFEYPWLKGPAQIEQHGLLGNIDSIRSTYLLSNLKADTAKHNVTKFVHIQAECAESSCVDETSWIESIASKDSVIAGIVPFVDLTSPDAPKLLAAQAGFPHVRGIRHMLNWHEERANLRMHNHNLIHNEMFHQNYSLLAQCNLHFEFHGFHTQLNDALTLAMKYPKTLVIVNHSGLCIDRTEDGINYWRDGLVALATQANTAIKISGLGQTDHQWTAESFRPFVLAIIEIFGTHRCMFASNFPVEKVVGSYDALYTAFKQIVAHLPLQDQNNLFLDTAVRLYRL